MQGTNDRSTGQVYYGNDMNKCMQDSGCNDGLWLIQKDEGIGEIVGHLKVDYHRMR
jgi:hypothetical protein